jgi:hypothetical protein
MIFPVQGPLRVYPLFVYLFMVVSWVKQEDTIKNTVICHTESFCITMKCCHINNILGTLAVLVEVFLDFVESLVAGTRIGPQLDRDLFHIPSDSSVILPFHAI